MPALFFMFLLVSSFIFPLNLLAATQNGPIPTTSSQPSCTDIFVKFDPTQSKHNSREHRLDRLDSSAYEKSEEVLKLFVAQRRELSGPFAKHDEKPFSLSPVDIYKLSAIIEGLESSQPQFKGNPVLVEFRGAIEKPDWFKTPTLLATFIWLTHPNRLQYLPAGELQLARKNPKAIEIANDDVVGEGGPFFTYEKPEEHIGMRYGIPTAIAAGRAVGAQRMAAEAISLHNAQVAEWNRRYLESSGLVRFLMDLGF